MDPPHAMDRTLAGTFEALAGDRPCTLVVRLDDGGSLDGHLAFGPLRLWLRGAHADHGRLGVGLLGAGGDGAPLAWVRLRTDGDALYLDLAPPDLPDASATSSVEFGRVGGAGAAPAGG